MFSNSGELKRILLFGAGKSATSLIDYLIQNLSTHQWELIVADGNLKLAQDKIGNAEGTFAVGVDVQNDSQRNVLIQGADIVMMLLPDEQIGSVYRCEVEPNIKAGAALAFAPSI